MVLKNTGYCLIETFWSREWFVFAKKEIADEKTEQSCFILGILAFEHSFIDLSVRNDKTTFILF